MSQETQPHSETTESSTDSETDSSPADDATTGGREYPITAVPTVRPTLVWLVIVGLGGGALTGLVVSNPGLFGGATQANVVGNAVLLLTGIGVARFLIRVYVLRRTEYVVDERSLVRQYSLLLRTWRREVPLTMVRSHQLEQGRIQKLLGYGTISVNDGLGDIRFENVRDPRDLNEVIAEQVSRAAGRGHPDGT
ncbi:PH domain-containing protein [Halobaculum sp. MBLA0143]|uniref:PH domain-containing protein n=1 Tax=Halobaculum sp. MBLA0143 TaxID=3079933 RepID=UPI0035249879